MRAFISLFMIIASVIGFVVFVVPKYNNIQELRTRQAEFDVALDNAKRLQAEREKLLEQLQSFAPSDLDRLEILLPDNIDNVKLILELDSLARQFGISLQDVDVVEEEAQGDQILIQESLPYDMVNIEFSAFGDYVPFVSFLESIETSLRLIDVYDVSFKNPNTPEETYEYNVKIRTYWLK